MLQWFMLSVYKNRSAVKHIENGSKNPDPVSDPDRLENFIACYMGHVKRLHKGTKRL